MGGMIGVKIKKWLQMECGLKTTDSKYKEGRNKGGSGENTQKEAPAPQFLDSSKHISQCVRESRSEVPQLKAKHHCFPLVHPRGSFF